VTEFVDPPVGPPADPFDEPLDLSRLLSPADLDDLAQTFARAHGCGVAVLGRHNELLAAAELSDSGGPRAPIEYQGERMGWIQLDGGTPAVAQGAAELCAMVLHHAHARRLTGVAHEAATTVSYADLAAKNKSLEAAVARLRDADRVKSNFLATMSHELRTPLTSVIGYSEMLLEGLAGRPSEDQREYGTTIPGTTLGAPQTTRVTPSPVAIAGLCSTIVVELVVVLVVAWPLDPAELRAAGTPLVVTDRNGVVLATVPAPGGRPDADHWVPLAEVPSVAVAALLESEDRGFWDHGGVDFRAIVRAAWRDGKAGRTPYGGPTITIAGAAVDGTAGFGESCGVWGTLSGVGAGDEGWAVIGERHCGLLQKEIGMPRRRPRTAGGHRAGSGVTHARSHRVSRSGTWARSVMVLTAISVPIAVMTA